MDYLRIINTIVSVLLLPVNFICSFWIFQQALNLSGITFREMLHDLRHYTFVTSENEWINRRRMRKRQRILFTYLATRSGQPEKIRKWLQLYAFSTLPGAAAIGLAGFGAYFLNADKTKYILVANIVLVLINVALAAAGKVYCSGHPLDAQTAEKLRMKRDEEKAADRPHRAKNIVVYTLVGLFFVGILSVILLAANGVFIGNESPVSSSEVSASVSTESEAAHPVQSVLQAHGFETEGNLTSFWEYDQSKLVYDVCGEHDVSLLDYYEYTDGASTDTVYDRIITRIWPDMEADKRSAYETELTGGGKMFTLDDYGSTYFVLYQNNTVIYAFSMGDDADIRTVLRDLGYTE